MLVVSRKIGERILIGDKIVVTVVKIGSGGVRIGIEAPSSWHSFAAMASCSGVTGTSGNLTGSVSTGILVCWYTGILVY